MKPFLHRIFHSIIFQIFLVAVVFWVYHLLCPLIKTHYNINAGTIHPATAPLYSRVDIHFDGWVILPLIALGIYFLVFRTIFTARQPIPLPIILVLVIALKVALDVSIAMIDGGLPALGEPINKEVEYYSDVPRVEGIREFLHDYVDLAPTLSLHSGTHPPGGALFIWTVARIFSYDLLTAAFAIILFSTLSVIPMYLLANQLHGQKVGYYTLALYLITPNLVLFTATSMDGVFTVFPIWSVYLFYRALAKKPVRNAILTGIALSLAMFLNFTATFIGAYFIVVTILTFLTNRERFQIHLKVLLIAGATFIAFYFMMYRATGYNLLASLRVAIAKDEGLMGTGYESVSRYLFISVANIFAFFICVGVPTTTLWVKEVISSARQAFQRIFLDNYLLAYVIMLVIIDFAALYTLEVERIWMFMTPFVLIPTAKHLENVTKPRGKKRRQNLRLFYGVATLLCIQILAFEILLNTRW